MANEKYLSDLKGFMDDDSDLDTDISGIDYNDYSKFITDVWNCDEDKIDWYNVCFSDYNGGGGNKHISSWNTSCVVYMTCMFRNAQSFNQNINSWNTSRVIYMSNMFNGSINFNQNINSWILHT